MVSSIQNLLRSLWCEILELHPNDVAASSNFFDLGGDSVAVIRLIGLSLERGLVLDTAAVFEHPELQEMAYHCKEIAPQLAVSNGYPHGNALASYSEDVILSCEKQCCISRDQFEDIVPSTAQQRFVMSSYLQKGAYFSQMVFRFQGSESRLHRAWTLIEQRNPILRTRLVDIGLDGTVFHDVLQVVVKDDNYEWGQSANLDKYKIENAEIDMDYGTRLSRCAMVDPADNSKSKYFVWTFLQATVDGWTKRLLLKDLDACLIHAEDSAAQLASRLPFRSFVEHIFTIDKRASLDFWKTRMEGVEHVHFLSTPLLGNALS